MNAATPALSAQALAWALAGISQIHRLRFAPELLLKELPPPYDLNSLRRAALLAGIPSRLSRVRLREIPARRLPCFALLKPGPGEAGEPARLKLALLLRIDDSGVELLSEGEERTVALPLAELEARALDQVLFLGKPRPPGEEQAGGPAFGFSWFLPELLKHRAVFRDVLLASAALQLMALAAPLLTQVVIDKVVVHHTTSTLLVITTALALFLAFTAAFAWVRQYLVIHTANRIDAVLGYQVFAHLLRLPARYFEQRATGTLVARLQGVETIREFLTGAVVTLILDIPFLLLFLAVMFYYSVALTLIALALLFALAGLSALVTPLFRARLNRQFLLAARNQAFLTEYVSGMETVKSLQLEPQLESRYGDYLASYLHAGFGSRNLANTYNVAAQTLNQLLMLAVLCFGAWLIITEPGFTVGMLVAFQMFASRLSQPLLRLVSLWQEFQQAVIAVRRLGDILDFPQEPYGIVPCREAGAEGGIEIRGLCFRYHENLPWLFRDFSLTIAPGECVAVMGPSGSGKSTLAKLLQGFYFSTEGEIRVGGREVRHLPANELRRAFGVVPQETQLFSGTIYDNLILANPHAGFEQVIQACKAAEIHDFIEGLPQGYESAIGERGVGLSGGQKQRIAIARALLKRAPILIFDEATSNLDAETAEHLARTMNVLKGKVTMLVIAHQLPKGLQVDRVVELGQR